MKKICLSLAASALFLFLGSCESQQLKYEDEIRLLREQKIQLKKENDSLRAQVEDREISMAEASTVKPDVDMGQNAELKELGIDSGYRGSDFVISIPSEITFPSGKAELTKQGEGALKAVARVLLDQHRDGSYWIEGHTDSDPIKKSKWDSNRELSVARAMTVLHFLVEECGVPDERCVVAGHGQYEPVADNRDSTGKARNRRVEIVVQRR